MIETCIFDAANRPESVRNNRSGCVWTGIAIVITATTCIGLTWTVTNYLLPRVFTSSGIETTTAQYQHENQTSVDEKIITCRSNFKDGIFHLGDIQFQTILEKSWILAKSQNDWEKKCKELEMELFNETSAIAIFAEVKNDDFWKVASGNTFWLQNKTPLIHG